MIVDYFLDLFQEELRKLDAQSERFIIGGSCALLLHGLELDWEPSDLDIIIFDHNSRPGSWKIEKAGKILNYVYAPLGRLKTPGLLRYRGYEVNSIKEVIKYKHTEGQEHCRLKDIRQMLALKNLNFNM